MSSNEKLVRFVLSLSREQVLLLLSRMETLQAERDAELQVPIQDGLHNL